MRMGWLMTLILLIAATMPPIAMGQEAQEEQTDNCPHPKDWTPAAEDLPRILAEHQRWVEQWQENRWSEGWARKFPQGRANLCKADLSGRNLTGARLEGANLTGARLNYANLTKARLNYANLTGVRLKGANLTEAQLEGANLTEAQLKGANLTDATYNPASPAPDGYVADIQGLQTVVFPKGQETGLVKLRDLLQKAGLRDLEREATFTLEHGKTFYLLNLFDHWQFDRSASYQNYPSAEKERREFEEGFCRECPEKCHGV